MTKAICRIFIFLILICEISIAQNNSFVVNKKWLPNKHIDSLKISDTLLLNQQTDDKYNNLRFTKNGNLEYVVTERLCKRSWRSYRMYQTSYWNIMGNWTMSENLSITTENKVIVLKKISIEEDRISFKIDSIKKLEKSKHFEQPRKRKRESASIQYF